MCFGKKEANPEQDVGFRNSEAIDKQLREDKKRLAREIKILLLGTTECNICFGLDRDSDTAIGAGESGKSTILKQMKMIYANGFNDQDRKQWRVVIFANLISAFHTILQAMEELEEPFKNANNQVSFYHALPRRRMLTLARRNSSR